MQPPGDGNGTVMLTAAGNCSSVFEKSKNKKDHFYPVVPGTTLKTA
jgi:hypothetical protein